MNIPEERKELDQWVCWKKSLGPDGKLKKIPYDPKTGEFAKANIPGTWADYETAAAAANNYDGIGFEFLNGGNLFGIDLDHVIKDGVINPIAKEIIDTMDSYTERSPSGQGVHILAKGTIPDKDRRKDFIEMYSDGRYFTITGNVYNGRDGWKLGPFLVSIFPQVYQPEIRELISRLGQVWNNYFVGQIKLMLYIGVGTFLITSFLGMKWVVMLGIIAGFLEIIPNIGPIIAAIPAILSAAIFGSSWIDVNRLVLILIVIAAYTLIQQLENVIVVTRIMGKAMELHPVLIILGVLILSSRLGILGALLASPILGILKVALHFVISKIKKEDPYPELYAETQ